MRLYEHPDFDQAIVGAARHFQRPGLTEQLIEKDYYVTEALRPIQARYADRVIFKGGTSLSKGWDLIRRFSEDIDLFVNPVAFQPILGTNAINRELKVLRDTVLAMPGLTLLPSESKTVGGMGRSDYYHYVPRFEGLTGVASRILLETGTSSGSEPTEFRPIMSFVAKFLQETGFSLEAEDETCFELSILHFRRTFVEKMFAIHAKVEILKESKTPIGSYARHYYDLACLAATPEVRSMLQSPEYDAIKANYEAISLSSFAKNYRRPDDFRFANSDALFPSSTLSQELEAAYVAQCAILCFDSYPGWSEVLGTFEDLRHLL